MSYGDKARAMIPLLDGTLTAYQIAERVGCDAKTVRGLAKRRGLSFKQLDRSINSTLLDRNRRTQAEAETAGNFVWDALREQIESTGRVDLQVIADEMRVSMEIVSGLVIRLRNHGRLKRTGGSSPVWSLFRGDERVCRSTSKAKAIYTMPSAFRSVRLAPLAPSGIEDAKLYLRRRRDVVFTEGHMHRLNYRTWLTDAELLAFCDQAKARDARMTRRAT